jgi:hypothetical protein
MDERLPLSVLLSKALVAFTIEFDNEAEHAPADKSRLLLGLKPYADGWRAAVREPETLPHFPMVLHRGGFPDGS